VIVLVGFMGAGKTTVGHLLSERLGLPFLDSDLVIEQRTGCQIRQFFAENGEPAFRELESRVICELVDGSEAVLALGGGAAGHPDTIAGLKSAQVIYLQVSYEEAMLRVAGDPYRPMLSRPGIEDLYQHRLSLYDTPRPSARTSSPSSRGFLPCRPSRPDRGRRRCRPSGYRA
jgi:shikimate kinase